MRAKDVKILVAALTAMTVLSESSNAQTTKVMPLAQIKTIMDATKNSWLAFRVYSGRQLIYFTQIISWHCGLSEIRYSLNGTDLDKRFPVPKCNPHLPNNIGQNDKIYLEFKPNTVKTVAVQLIYDDASASDVHIFGPCPNVGGATCAQLVETRQGSGVAKTVGQSDATKGELPANTGARTNAAGAGAAGAPSYSQ